jgi:hypothetical protein
MKLDERNKKKIQILLFFISMANAAKFVLSIPIFFSTPQKLLRTTVDIPTKFHEV